MIRFLRKVWNDRRGNALIIAGASLPLLVGAAGLGTDTVQWVLWKRELQRAADSGALAGAYAELQSDSVSDAVSAHLYDNNHTAITLLNAPDIQYPADVAGSFTSAVQVTLQIQKPLGFSSLFLSNPPTITATATAALVDTGSYCVVALNNSTDPSITIGGSTNINMGCGAISNSTSADASVETNGASYNFVADPVAGAGGMPDSITGATDIQAHHVPMQDPFAGQYSTDVPSGTPCNNFNQNSYTTRTGTGQNQVTVNHLRAGCYSGNNAFKISGNVTYYLDPGVYYLDSTNFDISGGATLIGTDVTFILTGTTPGSVSTNGNSNIQLTAPTSGPYANMLFIGMGSTDNTINGTNTSFYDGAMYFPNSTVNFTGTTSQMTQCAMVVADFVNFSGNSGIQNSLTHPDGSPCQADTQVQGKAVRLIA